MVKKDELLTELVEHFKEVQETLRKQWIQQMTAKGLLKELTPEEIEKESTIIYDTCIDALKTGKYDYTQDYANRFAQRGVLQGMTPEQIFAGFLTLRDVYGRSLFEKFQDNKDKLSDALYIYEPVANNILSIVAQSFITERETLVRKQQESIYELSTPVLKLRDRLLIMPLIGVIDTLRARQMTEQLLHAIRENRASVVIIDVTGVSAIDSKVANHLLQTVDSCKLMGVDVIVCGISAEVSQTLVTIGVDLTNLNTVGDLQGSILKADVKLGLKVVQVEPGTQV